MENCGSQVPIGVKKVNRVEIWPEGGAKKFTVLSYPLEKINFHKTNTRDIEEKYFNLPGHLNIDIWTAKLLFILSNEGKLTHWHRRKNLIPTFVPCGKNAKCHLHHILQILQDDLHLRWWRKSEWLKGKFLLGFHPGNQYIYIHLSKNCGG